MVIAYSVCLRSVFAKRVCEACLRKKCVCVRVRVYEVDQCVSLRVWSVSQCVRVCVCVWDGSYTAVSESSRLRKRQ